MKAYRQYLYDNDIELSEKEIQQAFGYQKLNGASYGGSTLQVIKDRFKATNDKYSKESDVWEAGYYSSEKGIEVFNNITELCSTLDPEWNQRELEGKLDDNELAEMVEDIRQYILTKTKGNH